MKRIILVSLSFFFVVVFLGCQSEYVAKSNQNWDQNNSIKDKKEAISTNKTLNETNPWQKFQKPPNEELKKMLTPLQYEITQQEGTERAFDNEYWDSKEEGIYVDTVSGEPLFSSTDKFDSQTGWPSFTKPLVAEHIVEKTDHKLMYPRVEIRSKYADSHLGHVFNDGPAPAYLRYCMNSAALRFIPKNEMQAQGYGEFLYLFE